MGFLSTFTGTGEQAALSQSRARLVFLAGSQRIFLVVTIKWLVSVRQLAEGVSHLDAKNKDIMKYTEGKICGTDQSWFSEGRLLSIAYQDSRKGQARDWYKSWGHCRSIPPVVPESGFGNRLDVRRRKAWNAR